MNEGPKPALVVLTGGPGGGKSQLIVDLSRDSAWIRRVVGLPEAISLMRPLGLSPSDKVFQRAIVHVQMALETESAVPSLAITLVSSYATAAASIRSPSGSTKAGRKMSSSPSRGRHEQHYRRYLVVIHLVTAADGVCEHYPRWPEAHRPEQPEDAIRLDRLLEPVWGGHPRYFKIDNAGRDWEAKSQAARRCLSQISKQFAW